MHPDTRIHSPGSPVFMAQSMDTGAKHLQPLGLSLDATISRRAGFGPHRVPKRQVKLAFTECSWARRPICPE